MHEPSDYWAEFAGRLRALGVEVALIGALAAMQYRDKPRATTDVDFLARDFDATVIDAFRADGYDVRAMAEPGGDPYVFFLRGHSHRVDVLKAETPFQHSALDRAIDGVITAEDVLVFKLLAWRPRDQSDVRSILAAGHRLDVEYIAGWADEWEVADRWAEAQAWVD